MPILRNRSIEVGDVMTLNRYEEVISGADRCYPSLQTKREQQNGEDSVRNYTMWSSIDVIAEISGGAKVKKIVNADASLTGSLNDRAAINFSNVIGILPSPDIQALFPENVEKTDTCKPVLEVIASPRYNNLLVTRVYQGSVSVGFAFLVDGGANISASTGRLGKALADVNAEISVEGNLTTISLNEWTNGVIAVQSSRIDRDKLAEAWILMNENPETIAELESLIGQYLGEEDPGFRQELSWGIRSFMEKIGWFGKDIDEMRRNIFMGEKAEEYTTNDIPDEHWRAAAAVASALIIQNAE